MKFYWYICNFIKLSANLSGTDDFLCYQVISNDSYSDEWVLVFYKEGFPLPVPSQFWKIIYNAKLFLLHKFQNQFGKDYKEAKHM